MGDYSSNHLLIFTTIYYDIGIIDTVVDNKGKWFSNNFAPLPAAATLDPLRGHFHVLDLSGAVLCCISDMS